MASSGGGRTRTRFPLHWTVRVFRQPGRPSVESITKNLSSEGFYCITSEPFKLGERLQCMIVIPSGGSFGLESSVGLECHGTVRRMEKLPRGVGLGCHIEDYTLTGGSPPRAG